MICQTGALFGSPGIYIVYSTVWIQIINAIEPFHQNHKTSGH